MPGDGKDDMSVPKGDRKESAAQFLDNALKLRIYTQDRAKRLPNRELPYEGKLLATASYTIFQEIVTANNIRVRTKDDAVKRLGYFNDAEARLKALAAEIDVAAELIRRAVNEEANRLKVENEKRRAAGQPELRPKVKPMRGETLRAWHQLINDEIRLLEGVQKSELKQYREKFKTAPEFYMLQVGAWQQLGTDQARRPG